jgi:hypothetical protein
MGPGVVIERVDLDFGEVHARRDPTDPMSSKYPVLVTSLSNFCASFRLL